MGIEYADDDAPGNEEGMLRETISHLLKNYSPIEESEIKEAYGDVGVRLYKELKNASRGD